MSQSLPTTAADTKIDEAKTLLQTDWDSDGSISVHLPQAQAERLLQRLGWVPLTTEAWVSSDGRTFEFDEALTLALVALGLSPAKAEVTLVACAGPSPDGSVPCPDSAQMRSLSTGECAKRCTKCGAEAFQGVRFNDRRS